MNPPPIRRLAPHEKTQLAAQRGRALPPDAATIVRKGPDAGELPTTRREPPREAPTTVRRVPEPVVRRQAPVEGPTTVRRVVPEGPTTVRRAPVRIADDAPTTVRPVPSLAAPIAGELPERPARLARGSFPSPMPQPPAPAAAPPTKPVTVPAPAAVAAARPSVLPPAAELARGSQPPPQQVSPEVFALIRRIALQQTLADAAGVLHAGLANLVSARVVLAQISETDAISSPITAELRDAAKHVQLGLVAETARRRQRFTADRIVLVPLPTSSRAVLVVWRKPEAPPLDPEAIRTATAVATRLGILDHFLAAASEKQVREEADKQSLFRPEALAASRETRKDGQLVDLSPRILRIAIPAILAIATALVIAAAIVQVPTYSRGTIVVKANGQNVISNSSGRIARVLVTPGQQVRAGDPVIELDTTNEQQVFAQIDTNYRDQLSTFLFDTTDEAARASLAGILAQRKAARDALVAKTITAPVDGAITDVLVTDIVNAGEHVATIIPEGSQPSVLAFMPGSDRSRFTPGMTMQVELAGYPGSRLALTVTEVGTDIMGSSKARKLLGEKLADAVALPPSVVLVKAALPVGGFESRGKTYNFFDGMDGLAEIEIEKRSFLSVVLPIGD